MVSAQGTRANRRLPAAGSDSTSKPWTGGTIPDTRSSDHVSTRDPIQTTLHRRAGSERDRALAGCHGPRGPAVGRADAGVARVRVFPGRRRTPADRLLPAAHGCQPGGAVRRVGVPGYRSPAAAVPLALPDREGPHRAIGAEPLARVRDLDVRPVRARVRRAGRLVRPLDSPRALGAHVAVRVVAERPLQAFATRS